MFNNTGKLIRVCSIRDNPIIGVIPNPFKKTNLIGLKSMDALLQSNKESVIRRLDSCARQAQKKTACSRAPR